MTHLSWFDRVLIEMDVGLRTICPPIHRKTMRDSPARSIQNVPLSAQEKQHAIGLMRVNHSGEVCAQALYQGQAITARKLSTQNQLRQSALEEVDHLGWCEDRLRVLGGEVSLFNPFWYVASFFLGATAGLMGDGISLGFVVEVERQVEAHLAEHLTQLPVNDVASKAVLLQMQTDEMAHAKKAQLAGGLPFPTLVKKWMRLIAQGMTKGSYYL